MTITRRALAKPARDWRGNSHDPEAHAAADVSIKYYARMADKLIELLEAAP